WDAEADPLNGAKLKAAPEWLIKKLGQKKALAKPPEGVTLLPSDEVKRIRQAITYISCDDRDTWLQVGMALHSTNSGDQAYGLWNEWANQSDKFDLADQRRVWNSFKLGSVTLGSLFALAKNSGWIAPTTQAALSPPLEAYAQQDKGNPLLPDELTDSENELLNPPPELDPIALHGLLSDACKVSTEYSEASAVAIAANIIGTFSAIIGRNPFVEIGDGFCNVRPYFLLTGKTGKARKGTSEYTPKRIFDLVEKNLGEDYVSVKRHEGGLSTGEGLGWAIKDDTLDENGNVVDPGTDDKRLYVVEAEWAATMAAASREKNNLSATIRTAWDGKTISPLVKNSKWCTTDPHIVITGHITAAELIDRMKDVDALSGFMNRFVILHIVRPKLVPLPKRTPDEDVQRIAAQITEAVQFATGNDFQSKDGLEVTLSKEAAIYWKEQYSELTKDHDGIAGALLVRAEIYCRMFAACFALLDELSVVEVIHIKAALAWINYWKASVRYIFQTLAAKAQTHKLDEQAKEVYSFITKSTQCTRTEITKHFKHKYSSSELTATFNHLMNSAPPLIKQTSKPRSDGRPGKATIIFSKA
ncbi:MAG: PriCT-2 domain-containing protein, partial [Cycloclasticus sp.]|nr:PriCT-2 domain-containing protein [Cycloclasticus sp.]